ncbi:MAG: SdrD B-like domain-containing protein, partial [Bacteroidota bacterium]
PNLVTSLPGVVADASGTSITVPSGTVLQPGLTNIQVDVVAPVDGFYINEIPAEALQTTGCSNPEPAEATIDLNAAYVIAPIIDKAFDADMLAVGDQTTLTLTVDNRNAQNFVVAADFTDEMPAGLMVTGAVGGTCPGVSTFSSTNMVGIVRGTTLTPGPCTITVQVEGTDPGLHCNLIQYNSLMVDVTLPGGAVVSTSNQDLAEACIEVVNNPIFDLALRKTLAPMQSDTVDAGGSVSFAITIFNQGTTTGTDIQITDYISSDLTLIDDATWEISGDDAILENPIPSLAPGADTTIIIQFDIDAGFTGESITNLAEISGANGGTDKDSTPDGNETNDNGGLVQSPSDDVILGDPTTGGGAPFDENGLTDEDDADPAIVFLRILPEDLNCTMVLSATPGDCVPASGTYDLTGSITFSNAPATGSLTISVDGVVAETIMSFTSPQSFTATGLAADGLQHSVSAAFSDDPACNASLDYTAPVSCADAGACTVSLTAVPGDCDPADNSYALSGQITFADAPASGTVTVSVGPFSQTYTLPATSPLDYQLTGLASDGSSQTVSVSFSENAACTNTADFVAPATCLPGECSLALTASPGTCAPATNLFSITGDLTISNAPATGSLTISTAGASTTFAVNALPTTYTLSGLVSDGSSRTVTATFTDDAGCTASVDIDSPESCSDPDPACAISMDLTPSPCVDGNYSVSGTVSFVDPPASGNIIVSDAGATLLTIALPTSSPLSFTLPGLMADGLTETLTVEFSEDATCTNTASFTAPAACMDPCDVMATATEVSCDDNGTAQDATDDYITFKLNPTGTSLGASYSVSVSAGQVFTSGGSPATGIPYGTETMFRLTNGSIGAGDVTVTVTDDTSPGCSTTTDVTDPITPCSDCIDPTTTLTPTASTCTDATENNDGTITWTSATNATHYGVSSADAAMYDGPTTTASATAAPVDGTEIVTGVVHAGASYIVRVFNMDDDCFVDVPVTVDAGAVCMEPACDLMITNISVDCTNGTEFTVSFEVAWDFANATTDMIEVTVDGDAQTPFTPGTAMGTQAFGPITVTGPANDILLEATFLTNTSCNTTALVDLIACTPDCVNGSGTVGGNVFNDFNNDGADAGAGEVGQANVLVEVYDCDGMLVCSVYTNADGNWSCDGLNDAEEYRVEFSTPLQDYLAPSFAGTDNGTNTQVVTAPTCEVDYGVVNPEDYCQENPTMATACYQSGDPLRAGTTAGSDVLVSFPYDASGVGTNALVPFGIPASAPIAQKDATAAQIGSTWGMAWERSTQTLYAAAMVKRHVGIGPLGEGGIYKLDYSVDP